MAKQVLLYERAVPLSSEKHRGWSVKTGGRYAFARNVNAVPLTAIEILAAASEYPIIFAGADDNLMPLAVLGTRQGENLYVKEDGSWDARYVPAFVRRYPFVFATGGDRMTLCIDESFEGWNQEGRGERLFDSQGERTQYLDQVLGFLREYEAHFQRTRAYCAKLRELDLLEPMQARVAAEGGGERPVTGFQAVNRGKLRAIGDDQVAALFRTDELELTFLHLYSLRNFRLTLERAGRQPPAADRAPSMAEGDPHADGVAGDADGDAVH